MKKILLSALVCSALFASNSHAQLEDGSIAPDWTLTDINGNSHNLYNLLDNGYSVVIDLNATWCPPCWDYHVSGELEDLWVNHGPAGGNGVSANTTDDVYVFMVESDGSTTSADLNGNTEGTMGDWVTGTMFPIIDDASISGPYGLSFYPTIYTICPNRTLTRVGGQTGAAPASAIYSHVGTCEVPSAANNGSILGYTGETISCGNPVAMSIDIQNLGTENLTACTINVLDGGTSVLSYNWTGNLSTYAVESVSLGTVNPSASTTYTIELSADDDASDNTTTATINIAGETAETVTVELLTDTYADEIWMEITNQWGGIVWSEGNENVQGDYDTGQFPPAEDPTNPLDNATSYSWEVTLTEVDCFTFTIYDYYGDGLQEGAGGSWSIKDNNGTVILSESAVNYGGMDSGLIKNTVASLDEVVIQNVNIYPNPASGIVNVSFEAQGETLVSITDLQGRILATQSASSANVTQVITFATEGFAKGTYVVSVNSNGLTSNSNIVIK